MKKVLEPPDLVLRLWEVVQEQLDNVITKTCPCNIQRFFSAVKIENFVRKNLIFFLFLHKT